MDFVRFLVLLGALYHKCYADFQEVCDAQSFDASCGSNQVLLTESARYGRTNVGQCVDEDMGYLGCGVDVLTLFDGWCSGRPSCNVPVNRANEKLAQGNTCKKSLVSNLEIRYSCVNVAIPSDRECKINTVSHGTTLLSSYHTEANGCGSMSSPWIIDVSPGQRIDLELLDFATTKRESRSYQECVAYGYISERQLGINRTICGGKTRLSHIFTSASGRVEIQVIKNIQNDGNFLVKYQVNGCPDVTPPEHAWYKRDGNTAVIGCEWSDHSWHLTCEQNTWIGVVGNCSRAVIITPPPEDELLPLSPVVSVSLIVGLGVIAAALLCIICIGLICIKRKGGRPQQNPYMDQQSAFLYHPGRPVPLDGGAIMQPPPPLQQFVNPPGPNDDLIHIWETPLPQPRQNKLGGGDSEIGSPGIYASLPSSKTGTSVETIQTRPGYNNAGSGPEQSNPGIPNYCNNTLQ